MYSFTCKSRNESFKPSYSMIGQCLSNKNKNATVSKSKNFSHLNKALNDLVSTAQNVFIKKRCIHDNFIYEQRVIQLLHKKRKSALFIKLDISKDFDSINWSFLLEVLGKLGFNTKWKDWITTLFGTATSRVLINGQPTGMMRHGRGLRQGDPLSPMLFILAIDPLQRIIQVAVDKGILSPVLPKAATTLRCSLYADDAAVFAAPTSLDIEHLHRILIFLENARASESTCPKQKSIQSD